MKAGKTSNFDRCPTCLRNKDKALREQRDKKQSCDKELVCAFKKEINTELKKVRFDIGVSKSVKKTFTIKDKK